MFSCTSIINNVLNLRLEAPPLVCTAIMRSCSWRRCWFTADTKLHPVHPDTLSLLHSCIFSCPCLRPWGRSLCPRIVNYALLLLLLLFFLREECSGSHPTGKTRVLAQKCNAAGDVYISICVGFHWFLPCESAHTYIWQHLSGPFSLFHHAHTDVTLTVPVSWWCGARIHSLLHQ